MGYRQRVGVIFFISVEKAKIIGGRVIFVFFRSLIFFSGHKKKRIAKITQRQNSKKKQRIFFVYFYCTKEVFCVCLFPVSLRPLFFHTKPRDCGGECIFLLQSVRKNIVKRFWNTVTRCVRGFLIAIFLRVYRLSFCRNSDRFIATYRRVLYL